MSDWLELYQAYLQYILGVITQFWGLITTHIWVLFPTMIAIVCCIITVLISLILRVVHND